MAKTRNKKGLAPFHGIDTLKHFIYPLSHVFGGFQVKKRPKELRIFRPTRYVKGSDN